MKFNNYLTEFSRKNYGAGITFIDIDETIFKTFAKVLVKRDDVVVRELNNQEYNSDVLEDGEEYDYQQFKSAKMFKTTSIPIPKTINRIKKMLSQIKSLDSDSRLIFLTARADFDNKEEFLSLFTKHGINMDRPNVYVERAGNMKGGTIDGNKKKIMLDYIKTGLYRRVRLIDDYLPNLKALKSIEKNLPSEIENLVIDKYDLDMEEEQIPAISFYALLVKSDGSLKLI